jgi:hypothetical protein
MILDLMMKKEWVEAAIEHNEQPHSKDLPELDHPREEGEERPELVGQQISKKWLKQKLVVESEK